MTNPPAITFGAFQRTGNPTLVCRNVYVEGVDTPSGRQLQLRARPGLASFKPAVGDGPLRGIGFRDGLFGNAALIVSDTSVFSLTASGVLTAYSGTVAGDGFVDIAFGQDADLNSVAYIASGSKLYKVLNGVVTEDTSFPEDGASSVDYISGNFVAVAAGSDKFYYLIPGGANWEPLDFQSAEYAPDPLVAVRVRGEQMAMLGSSTFQVFALSGDSANPFAPYGGLNEDFGCRSRATAVNCVGVLMFVDNFSNVRRWDGGVAEVVSAPGLAKLIASVDPMDLVAWTFSIPGHRFYVLRLGSEATWVYDLDGEGERWTTFDSYGYAYWRAQLGCNVGDTVLACDNISALIYRLEEDRRTDVSDAVIVQGSAIIEAAEVPQPLASLTMICDLGDAPLDGQGSDPKIQLRISRDTGKTFGAWKERPMGATGHYEIFPKWNALGQLPAHHMGILQFRVSDPIGRTFKRLVANA